MKCLISTIVRNRAQFLYLYYQQLYKLVKANPQIEFHLSLLENDSIDSTKSILRTLDFSFLKTALIRIETFNFPYFRSIVHEDRVKILAHCRNMTLETNLEQFDKILVIEPDIIYNFTDIWEWFNLYADIVSGFSHHVDGTLYDGWAVRKVFCQKPDWSPEYAKLKGYIPCQSTFNCFCLYDAEPIKRGIRFGSFSKESNAFDCDTAVICERFRLAGRNRIFIDMDKKVLHLV